MKLQIVSDLHLEFLNREQVIELADKISYNTSAEILILAGDICSFASHSIVNLCSFLGLMKRRYNYIIYVLGNHEHYGTSKQEIEKHCSYLFKNTNIYVLENESFTIKDVAFYGTTLWFEETVEANLNKYYLNDYTQIKDFTPDIWSKEAISYIKQVPNDNSKKVLITHHVPYSRFISPKYVGNELNCFYLNEIGKYLHKFDLVVFGHSHESVDQKFDSRCKAIANPRGYLKLNDEGENDRFNYQLIIEI